MDFSQNIANSPTFCPAPWTSLNVNQLGMVMPCIHSGYLLGNIKHESVWKILKAQPMQSMKQAQQSGQWHEACLECKNRETYGQSPRQTWHTDPQTLESIQSNADDFFSCEHLTVNWSNLCNLACTYCNAETSTAWQSVKHIAINHVKNEHDSLIDLVARTRGSLRGLNLGGGEPLLQKTLPLLLEKIDPAMVSVMVTTNLSVPLANNAVYNILKTWPKVSWMISFDNANQAQFEYVRHGASWSVFVDNIEIMQQHNQNILAHPAYSVYCALDLESLYQFCFDRQLDLFWCDLFHPDALDIRRQNQALRHRAVEQIDQITAKWSGKVAGSFDTLNRYRQQLIDPSYLRPLHHNEQDLKVFSTKVEKELGKTRTFQELWPQVYDLL